VKAVISQRLIPRKDGAGRVPAIEVMVDTPTIREYILNAEKTPMIHQVVAEGMTQYGMQTFDQSVLVLLKEGLITEEEALKNCNHPNELLLKLKGISGTSDRTWQPVDENAKTGSPTPATAGTPGAAASPAARAGKPEWMS
jgi:twitching motility protein PilT